VIVGSLACAAWTGQDSLARFSRPGRFGRTQRYPDVDVLVPRTAVAAVARYSRTARSGPLPAAVDVSGAACFIDLRPGCEMSYLTHWQLQFPVPTKLFTPRPARVAGTEIMAVDPRVLLYTFGTIGGIIRRKDACVGWCPVTGTDYRWRGSAAFLAYSFRIGSRLGIQDAQPRGQSHVIRDVPRITAHHLLAVEQHLGRAGLDLTPGQDEVDATRPRTRRKVFCPERRRAHAFERVLQRRPAHEVAEQHGVPVDVEVTADHDRGRDAGDSTSEGGKLGSVGREVAVCLGPVPIGVG